MFLHVLEARYLGDYRVWLRFSDGTSGEVDLSAELDGPVSVLLRCGAVQTLPRPPPYSGLGERC